VQPLLRTGFATRTDAPGPEIAMQTALSRRGVAVVVLPGDVAMRDAVAQGPRLHFPQPKPNVCPSDDE